MNHEKNSRYLLDTNAIIALQGIITNWNSSVRILIPQFVFQELSSLRMRNAETLYDNAINTVEQIQAKNFAHIVDISNYKKYNGRKEEGGLSPNDMSLINFAKEYQDNGKNICIVTNDKVLRSKAIEQNVKAITSEEFIFLYKGLPTIPIHALGKNSLEIYSRNSFGVTVLTFVSVFAVYYIAINFIHLITAMYMVQLLLICASGALLYYIRAKYRLAYSILEIFTGILLTMKGIASVQESFSIAFWLSVSGGQYIIVRGISNFMEGRQILIPYWRKIWGQNSE